MDIKLILIATIFTTLPCLAKGISTDKQNNLESFALSHCLAQGLSESNAKKEANAAAGAYIELGNYPAEAYEETSALVKHFLSKKYESKAGNVELTVMKCIDLSHSAELEAIEEKYRN